MLYRYVPWVAGWFPVKNPEKMARDAENLFRKLQVYS